MIIRFATLAGVGLGLAACVPTAPPYWLVAPADPTLRVRDPVYSGVTAGVKDYRVVEPKDWREQNRQVAPADDTQDRGQDSAAGARRGR
jgi:hypothetical protein